jgi:hypothetical protein
MSEEPLVTNTRPIKQATREHPPSSEDIVIATRDHELIREWARVFDAEPATGEASESGAASALKVADGGAGLRFNFPGVSRFRTISWTEWFEHFHRHDLTFVYENPTVHRPPSARYRLVQTENLTT